MFTVDDAKRYVKWTALVIVLLAAMIYASDYAWFRIREARNLDGGPFNTVTVYYATMLKNGQSALYYQTPQQLPCIESLLPHAGFRPCWYLRRTPILPIG